MRNRFDRGSQYNDYSLNQDMGEVMNQARIRDDARRKKVIRHTIDILLFLRNDSIKLKIQNKDYFNNNRGRGGSRGGYPNRNAARYQRSPNY